MLLSLRVVSYVAIGNRMGMKCWMGREERGEELMITQSFQGALISVFSVPLCAPNATLPF